MTEFRYLLMVGFVSLGLIAPACATSYIGTSLTNLTAGADLIVVGTSRRGAEGPTVVSTQIIKGAAAGTVVLSTSLVGADDIFPDGMTGIFFLKADKDPAQAGRFRPFHRDGVRPTGAMPQVRKVLAALANDAKLEELLRETESVDTIDVIGYRLTQGKRTPMKEPTASHALAYLRARLDSADSAVVYYAVMTLPRKPEDIVAVKKLFDHRHDQVRRAALHWFLASSDPSIVPDLCAYIASSRHPRDHVIADPALETVALRAGSRALPCLEAGAERGFQRGVEALGKYGTERSFLILLANADANRGSLCSALDSMRALVGRSNSRVEEWMAMPTCNGEIATAKLPMWRAWWQSNQLGFRVVREHAVVRK